ncbi:MAG: membrane protein [Candidatus Dormibacteraeota bacterium]|uniref:Membrane protein n=1 Tax=Candidatus Aeolococcus gillhamiae TaxID=3127015 RepID=A0A934K3N9_9BACT|nr:membrane protein [Candidatus Dormibacteraeota bacterium]
MVVRFLSLQAGLFCFGVGIPLTLQAHLGLSPWDVLHQGISRHTPLTIGQASELVGLIILLVAWSLGTRPGVGTLSNMLLVGFWIDRVISWGWIPDANAAPLMVRFTMLAGALLLFGIGSGAYIAPRLGAGPRDGIMLALARRTRRPVALVRGGIESSACLLGFLLGGTVGVGTLVIGLLLGPSVHAGLRLFGFDLHAVAPTVGAERGAVRIEDPLAEGL